MFVLCQRSVEAISQFHYNLAHSDVTVFHSLLILNLNGDCHRFVSSPTFTIYQPTTSMSHQWSLDLMTDKATTKNRTWDPWSILHSMPWVSMLNYYTCLLSIKNKSTGARQQLTTRQTQSTSYLILLLRQCK